MNYLTELDTINLPKGFTRLNENFIFELTEHIHSAVSFKVYEQTSWSGRDAEGNNLPDGVEIYLDGVIKWDGCSHIDLRDAAGDAEDNNYKHICGKGDWMNMVEMYEALYKHAMSIMPNADKSEIWKDS